MISIPPALKKFKNRIGWDSINHKYLRSHLELCLLEEIGFPENRKQIGDITSNVCSIEETGSAKIVAREELIVCGLPLINVINEVFSAESLIINLLFKDGDLVKKGDVIGYIKGNQKHILLVERTILNFLQRLSGIATKTKHFSKITESRGVSLLDTRKTTPGIRQLEKYASACGGSYNHRMGLYDRILIKDNHLAAKSLYCNGLKKTSSFKSMLSEIKRKNANTITEVEIDTIDLLIPAIESGIDAILLDNFTPQEIKKAVIINQNRVVLESSGGINERSLDQYANAKPHFISTGAPIHSSRWLDIGLDWN